MQLVWGTCVMGTDKSNPLDVAIQIIVVLLRAKILIPPKIMIVVKLTSLRYEPSCDPVRIFSFCICHFLSVQFASLSALLFVHSSLFCSVSICLGIVTCGERTSR